LRGNAHILVAPLEIKLRRKPRVFIDQIGMYMLGCATTVWASSQELLFFKGRIARMISYPCHYFLLPVEEHNNRFPVIVEKYFNLFLVVRLKIRHRGPRAMAPLFKRKIRRMDANVKIKKIKKIARGAVFAAHISKLRRGRRKGGRRVRSTCGRTQRRKAERSDSSSMTKRPPNCFLVSGPVESRFKSPPTHPFTERAAFSGPRWFRSLRHTHDRERHRYYWYRRTATGRGGGVIEEAYVESDRRRGAEGSIRPPNSREDFHSSSMLSSIVCILQENGGAEESPGVYSLPPPVRPRLVLVGQKIHCTIAVLQIHCKV